jgi:lipoate-protein ligase A
VDVKEAACALDGIPILRRNSGGGTVLLGSGCLLFSLILRYERSDELREIGSSYCHIFRRIRAALAPVVADVECAGTSDLTIHGRKFSGNAQQRKRAALLHHGTLLYQFDLERVARYLHPPERQPEYRAGREHADFLMNLPASAEELKTHLRTEWDAATELAHWPRKLMTQLVATKYTNSEWICRR